MFILLRLSLLFFVLNSHASWDKQHSTGALTTFGVFLASHFMDDAIISTQKSYGLTDYLPDYQINQLAVDCPVSTNSPPPDLPVSETENKACSESSDSNYIVTLSSCLTNTNSEDDDPPFQNNNQDEVTIRNDMCPICLEEFTCNDEIEITHCCGCLLHTSCLQQYREKFAKPDECPHCRAKYYHYTQRKHRPYKCNLCPRTRSYQSRESLENHLRSTHQFCWYCSIDQGNNYNIAEHYQSHRENPPCFCAQCSYPAVSPNQLWRHIAQQHSYHSPRSDCLCFGTPITQQQLVESGFSHYVCMICNHLTHTSEQFREHRRQHLLFQCTFCLERFPEQEELQHHTCLH